MRTFIAVNDELVSRRIGAASSRVVFVAPAVSLVVAKALGGCFRKAGSVSVTVVLDPDEDAYRIGYGDRCWRPPDSVFRSRWSPRAGDIACKEAIDRDTSRKQAIVEAPTFLDRCRSMVNANDLPKPLMIEWE
jgi:hypothetical protein